MAINTRYSVTTPPAATTRATTAADTTAAGEGVKSAKDLLSGGNYNLGVKQDSSKDQVADALRKIAGEKGAQYAESIESLGKGFKGRALDGIQKDMNDWLKRNQNATPAQVAEQAAKTLYKHTMVGQQFKQTMMQMANDAISRMKDTFEG